MRSLLLLAVLAAPGWAAPRAASKLPGAAPAAFSPAPVRWVAVGKSLIDARAPGAPLLLKALQNPVHSNVVLGLFDQDTKDVVNTFVIGEFGVEGHKDAIPTEWRGGPLGGYTFGLSAAGEPLHAGSGHFKNGISPAVERALHRHFGVVPAEESWLGWLKRKALNLWDRFERRFLA